MIKAYHQVGAEGWSDEQLQAALEAVLSKGKIEPASTRYDRRDMEIECFDEERGGPLDIHFDKATPKALAALKAMAREKIRKLPRSGFTQSLFNCTDLIAGDLDLIFLSPGEWYSVDNGFVFDAGELLMNGARFRPADLLRFYGPAIEEIVAEDYRTVAEARKAIEWVISDIHENRELTGREGLWDLESCMEHSGDYQGEERCQGEIVWPGTLPLDLAIEVWQNGKEITHLIEST